MNPVAKLQHTWGGSDFQIGGPYKVLERGNPSGDHGRGKSPVEFDDFPMKISHYSPCLMTGRYWKLPVETLWQNAREYLVTFSNRGPAQMKLDALHCVNGVV